MVEAAVASFLAGGTEASLASAWVEVLRCERDGWSPAAYLRIARRLCALRDSSCRMNALDLEKTALRRHCLASRRAVAGAGEALREVLLREVPPPPASVIGGFWPMGSEIDTRPLLEALLARGHVIALPVTPPRGNPLTFRPWSPGMIMARGPMGTQHPAAGPPITPDWLIIPLLAFDRSGARLGYGGGYYDRTLALLREAVAIGVAYAAQEIPEVPTGPHDVRLHAIATEQGLIRA